MDSTAALRYQASPYYWTQHRKEFRDYSRQIVGLTCCSLFVRTTLPTTTRNARYGQDSKHLLAFLELTPLTEKKGFGPDFQKTGSSLYRAEYGAISIAIIGYLVWRGLFVGGVDVFQTIFWVLFPDLVSFIPVGLSSKRREWPLWGVYLYDAVHNVIAWGLVFALFWFTFRIPSWPLFGWLGHITVDRTVGYGLRKVPEKP